MERFGFVRLSRNYPIPDTGKLIWIHAVSAGETNAIAPLVERLLSHGYQVLMTNMTATGRQRVQALFSDRVFSTYVPYDLPGSLLRFISRVEPSVLVLVDTEIWPNMLHAMHNRSIPVALLNGRLSARSARGYARIKPLTQQMMDAFSCVGVQADAQGERFIELGLPRECLHVTGSIKFDLTLPGDLTERRSELRRILGDRRVLVAASTHEGEEKIILDAFLDIRQACADVLLVLVPRHPSRSLEVIRLIAEYQLECVSRSDAQICQSSTDVYLVDTMGELLYCYAVADVAFVGGSLAPVGGHNPLEALALSVPVMMGPHLWNIEDIAGQLVSANALQVVNDHKDITGFAISQLDDQALRQKLIDNGRRVMAANAGALQRSEELIIELISARQTGALRLLAESGGEEKRLDISNRDWGTLISSH
jgi:3-deoxy-D-manno-octulosonic-acid transferase